MLVARCCAAGTVQNTLMSSPGTSAAAELLITHRGGCHCGAVAFKFSATPDLVAWDCNCSVCAMRRNTHVVVPKASFTLLSDPASQIEYRFGTRAAVHLFCRVCGITSYYQPRSNPDCWAVTVHCIEKGTVRTITTRPFDGRNWEDFLEKSGIRAFSAPASLPEGSD